jgi:hypothetical protein
MLTDREADHTKPIVDIRTFAKSAYIGYCNTVEQKDYF